MTLDEPFVFLDLTEERPYLVRQEGPQVWLYYWHPSKTWVTLPKGSTRTVRSSFLYSKPLPLGIALNPCSRNDSITSRG